MPGTLRALGPAVRIAVAAALGAALVVAVPGAPAAATPLQRAVTRDLGWSAAQAPELFAAQDAAGRSGEELRAQLGGSFAGAWLAAGALRVAVTDAAAAALVRAAGATPVPVTHSFAELAALRSALDDLAATARPPAAVTQWYVDAPSNSVVIVVDDAQGAADAATRSFLADARRLGDAVRVVGTDHGLTLRERLTGGDAIFDGNVRCSVGFMASTPSGDARAITAGHCTQAGGTVTGPDGVAIGDVTDSTFGPSGDFGVFAINSAWQVTPSVDGDGGAPITVTGSQPAPIGAAVCHSGSSSGYRCGEITATDVTANYAQGVVTGLTETSACSEAGDSGGPFLAGDQAQGVVSGGSGDCSSGGSTLFQPMSGILASGDLTLLTG